MSYTSQPGRRSSTRLRGKTPKLTEIVNSSDEEENLESDDDFFEEKEGKRKRVRKPGPAKKTKNNVTPVKYSSEPKSPSKALTKEGKSKKNNDAVNKLPKEFAVSMCCWIICISSVDYKCRMIRFIFHVFESQFILFLFFQSGSFVILKSDFHSTMTPPIWRIDGKALLQKYVHFDQEGQTLYKNTSTVTQNMSSSTRLILVSKNLLLLHFSFFSIQVGQPATRISTILQK